MPSRNLISIYDQPDQVDSASALESLEKLGLKNKLAAKVLAVASRPSFNILSDLPSPKDELGISSLVNTIASIVLSKRTQTPLTICIDGAWGTGKTSILKMIEAEARILNFPCIWLNAWSLESTENLIASTASEIQREFSDNQQSIKTISKAIVDWLVISSTITAKALDLLLPGSNKLLETSYKASQTLRGREADLDELASIVTSQRSFRNLVELLFKNQRSEDRRLIVFIDDLDRALPDQVAAILKNLKLILEVPQCIFVLAMDSNVVSGSIENYYRIHNPDRMFSTVNITGSQAVTVSQMNTKTGEETIPSGFGNHYLEKMIQITASVPQLTRQAVQQYLQQLGVAPEVQRIVYWTPDSEVLNPRRLKRHLNWLSLSLQLIDSTPRNFDADNEIILRFVFLQHTYPSIIRTIVSPDFFPNHNGLQVLFDIFASSERREASDEEFINFVGDLFGSIAVEIRDWIKLNPILGSTIKINRLNTSRSEISSLDSMDKTSSLSNSATAAQDPLNGNTKIWNALRLVYENSDKSIEQIELEQNLGKGTLQDQLERAKDLLGDELIQRSRKSLQKWYLEKHRRYGF